MCIVCYRSSQLQADSSGRGTKVKLHANGITRPTEGEGVLKWLHTADSYFSFQESIIYSCAFI